MTKPRAMLIEDEGLVAMLMEDFLQELGWSVAASFGAVGPALNWLGRGEDLDVAVLDINLGTEMVFPVAAALQATGTPFLFVTGYTAPTEAARFGAPILTKPVDLRDLGQALERLQAA